MPEQPTAEQAATRPGFAGDVEITTKDSEYIQQLTKGQGPERITGRDR